MTEHPDDSPTTEQLLKRIVQLEGMGVLVKRQQAEINSLKAIIDDLGGAFKSHVTNTCNNLKKIHDRLAPVVLKVFPATAQTQQQIDAGIRNGDQSLHDKNWADKKPH